MKLQQPLLHSVLRNHVKDLITLQMEYVAGTKAQRESEQIRALGVEALSLEDQIDRSSRLLEDNMRELHQALTDASREEKAVASLKSIVGAARAAFRTAKEFGAQYPVVAMLEDQHAILSRVMVKYEILHASALSDNVSSLGHMALDHLGVVSRVLEQLTELIPKVAVVEISQSGREFRSKVAEPVTDHIRETIG